MQFIHITELPNYLELVVSIARTPEMTNLSQKELIRLNEVIVFRSKQHLAEKIRR